MPNRAVTAVLIPRATLARLAAGLVAFALALGALAVAQGPGRFTTYAGRSGLAATLTVVAGRGLVMARLVTSFSRPARRIGLGTDSSRTRTVNQGSALDPACACPAPPECHADQRRPVNRDPARRNRPAFVLVSLGVEPPAGIEPATPSLPSMRRWFTRPCSTSRPHTTAQVRSAVADWVVGRGEAACSAVSGKSLASAPAWSAVAQRRRHRPGSPRQQANARAVHRCPLADGWWAAAPRRPGVYPTCTAGFRPGPAAVATRPRPLQALVAGCAGRRVRVSQSPGARYGGLATRRCPGATIGAALVGAAPGSGDLSAARNAGRQGRAR